MINILIANDNIYFSKQLMDSINAENVKISNLTLNGEETFNILNSKDDIDIILLKLKMPKYSGIQIMDMLSDIKKKRYKDSCIILAEENDIIKKIKDNEMVYSVIKNENNILEMIDDINVLIEKKSIEKDSQEIKSKIYNEIDKLHYNLSHSGTKYLIASIMLICKEEIEDTFNLKRDVYPKIAKKYNTSINIVKENIYKATDYMDINCDIETKKRYFNFQDDNKPTVKMVIYAIINHIYKNIGN